MVYPREVLLELRWNRDDLDRATITYVHRGAPGDVMTIRGSEIVDLGRSFMTTREATLPYHRIVRIEHRGSVLYDSHDYG